MSAVYHGIISSSKNAGIITQIRSESLPFTCFLFRHLLIIFSSDAPLNKLQITEIDQAFLHKCTKVRNETYKCIT